VLVPGQDQKLGVKSRVIDGALRPVWLNNAAAFNQPCQLGWDGTDPSTLAPKIDSPTGCIPLNGAAALGSKPGITVGPGVHRFDFSVFKKFAITERFSTEFRSEFFNVLNHPNFSPLGISSDPSNPSQFGKLSATRFNPYDPRQIQFALKLYY
jgi:hypothetical protein